MLLISLLFLVSCFVVVVFFLVMLLNDRWITRKPDSALPLSGLLNRQHLSGLRLGLLARTAHGVGIDDDDFFVFFFWIDNHAAGCGIFWIIKTLVMMMTSTSAAARPAVFLWRVAQAASAAVAPAQTQSGKESWSFRRPESLDQVLHGLLMVKRHLNRVAFRG